MDIMMQKDSVMLQIPQLPISGQEIVIALETAKMTVEAIVEIGKVILDFAKELGIFPECELGELGARTIPAYNNGIRPENYSTTEEWINVILQDDWGYSPKLNSQYTENERSLVGIAVVTTVLIEKFVELPMKEFFLMAPVTKEIFTFDRMMELAKVFQNDKESFADVINYISQTNKTNPVVERAIEILIGIEKKLDPHINDNEAYDKVNSY